jgi:hypothetical protein
MKITLLGLTKLAVALVAAGAAAGAGAHRATAESRELQIELLERLGKIESDVRILKCVAGFPGDCPGKSTPP